MDKKNIENLPVWKPMHLQPLYKDYAYYTAIEGVSISDRLFKDGLCLPSGSDLSEQEENRAIKIVLQKVNRKTCSFSIFKIR